MSNPLLKLAQDYWAAKEERLEADKFAASKKEVESDLKNRLMSALHEAKVNSVGDNKRIYAIVTKQEPQVSDWAAFYEHVKATGHFELLFRRVNPAAVKERWEDGVAVPGVGKFPVESLSVTKSKGA